MEQLELEGPVTDETAWTFARSWMQENDLDAFRISFHRPDGTYVMWIIDGDKVTWAVAT